MTWHCRNNCISTNCKASVPIPSKIILYRYRWWITMVSYSDHAAVFQWKLLKVCINQLILIVWKHNNQNKRIYENISTTRHHSLLVIENFIYLGTNYVARNLIHKFQSKINSDQNRGKNNHRFYLLVCK